MAAASRRGILIKGGAALEAAGAAKVVAIDKTGTLTIGRPEVIDVVPLPGGATDTRSLLAAAAAVEALSEHPLARAVALKAREEGIVVPMADNFLATPGKGASARVGGRETVVGSIRLARELGLAGSEERPSALAREMARLAEAGSTPLFVAAADDADSALRPLGVIAVADRLRPHAADAVRRMREAGIAHVAVLTGDTRATGEAIARAVGADSVLAELLPEEKAAAVCDLRRALRSGGDGRRRGQRRTGAGDRGRRYRHGGGGDRRGAGDGRHRADGRRSERCGRGAGAVPADQRGHPPEHRALPGLRNWWRWCWRRSASSISGSPSPRIWGPRSP